MNAVMNVDAIYYLIKQVEKNDQPWCRVQNMIYSDATEYCTPSRCPFCSPDELDESCGRHYQDEVA